MTWLLPDRVRQPRCDLGEHDQQDRGQDEQHKEGKCSFGDIPDVLACHGLQDKQVNAYRWRDLRHLNDDHQEDAEPDRVDARLLGNGHDDCGR